MPNDWYEEPPAVIAFVAGVLVLIGYIAHEAFVYSQNFFVYGLDPFAKVFWAGATDFAKVVVTGLGAEAASVTLISSITIPITILSTYTIFRKAKDKPKLLIAALSLFLDPLFINFFKDEIDDALTKMLVDAAGIVTFLAASYFWSLATRERDSSSKTARFVLQGSAILLYLTPTLAMVGYIAREAARDRTEFIHRLSPEKVVGLAGLLVVAAIGIMLSRKFEGP
jgi:hypothetical protein